MKLGIIDAFSWDLHADIVGRKPVSSSSAIVLCTFLTKSCESKLGPEGWATLILDRLGVGQNILTPEKYAEMYFEEIEKLYTTIEAMEGACDFLHFCSEAGIPVAIATSSPRDSFDKKMKEHPKLLELTQVVVCGDDPEVKRGKPSPDIFKIALKRLVSYHNAAAGNGGRTLSIPPESVLALEDSPYGVQAAVAAGMKVAAFPDPRLSERNTAKFAIAGPTWIFPAKGGLRKLKRVAKYCTPLDL